MSETTDATELPTISREELKAKLDRGDDLLLLEVMPEEDYRKAHLPGAKNMPPDAVRKTAKELLPDRDAEIVVYCSSPP